MVAGIVFLAYPAAVDTDGTGRSIAQVVLAIRDLGLAILLGALWTATGSSRLGRIGVAGGVVAMLGLAVLEIVSLAVEDIGAFYGIASLLIGLFGILAGIAVVRARIWSGRWRYLPLALGVYVFVPMTPGIGSGVYAAEQIAIAGWMALFAVVGLALVRVSDRSRISG